METPFERKRVAIAEEIQRRPPVAAGKASRHCSADVLAAADVGTLLAVSASAVFVRTRDLGRSAQLAFDGCHCQGEGVTVAPWTSRCNG